MYIGIDLGTSNSVIAGVDEGRAQVFRPADGGEALPSVIFIDKRGHRLYGRRAYDQAMISPEQVAVGFKRLMGTDTPIEIADQTLSPEECSAEIIRQLIGQVVTETGIETFSGIVISIPASFNQMQCEATLRAGKLAGLDHVDLIQEPVAAAIASMADAKRSGKFIIYDLGGGTFDVALVEATQGEVRILDQRGVNMLGGRDFDRMIVSAVVRPWLLANFDLPENFLRDPQYQRLSRIAMLAAERAKIDLSTLEEASIFASDDEVRLLDKSDMEIFLDVPITRAQFEEIIRTPIQNTIDLVSTLLGDHELDPADIDRVVYVGGPSRIPVIRRLLTEQLGIAADLKTDPMTAVAEGAAYYGENRQWRESPAEEAASEPKESLKHEASKGVPNMSFDYVSRTPDDKTKITIHTQQAQPPRRIRLITEGWDSDMLPLADGMVVEVPLQKIGENVFDVHLMDENGTELIDHAESLKVSRLVATTSAIPALHTIAVKVRKSVEGDENSFQTVVEKGQALPASGKLQLKSGTTLRAGTPSSIRFELFQVECPERVDLNLCVGCFIVDGADLPTGKDIEVGDPILFDWRMSESGLLMASVGLPSIQHEITARRFYVPQAGQISYEGKNGHAFARAVLQRAAEEWGGLVAALGPDVGPDISFLKTRLDEQKEILEESSEEPDTLRRVSEEARFIRQDTVKLLRKYTNPVLQRQLGKITALFNRVVRARAETQKQKAFDELALRVQKIIDTQYEEAYPAAQACLAEMQRLFFAIAWQDPAYVKAWFARMRRDSWLFADQEEHRALVAKGEALLASGSMDDLRKHVKEMLDARISFTSSDAIGEISSVIGDQT
jgi:molecular chaperone DnaK